MQRRVDCGLIVQLRGAVWRQCEGSVEAVWGWRWGKGGVQQRGGCVQAACVGRAGGVGQRRDGAGAAY